jgi:hypothetical protein
LSTAVWLFTAMIFGLDSTLVVPKESSSFTVLEMFPPAAAFGLLYDTEKNGASARLVPMKFWRKV